MFPRGGAGTGLFVLRVSAIASLHTLVNMAGHWAVTVLISALGVGLLVGLMTPAVSALSIASMLVLFILGDRVPDLASVTLLLQSIALILLGPGAYSMDARMYARRIIAVAPRD